MSERWHRTYSALFELRKLAVDAGVSPREWLIILMSRAAIDAHAVMRDSLTPEEMRSELHDVLEAAINQVAEESAANAKIFICPECGAQANARRRYCISCDVFFKRENARD